jgi:hypothetical protein
MPRHPSKPAIISQLAKRDIVNIALFFVQIFAYFAYYSPNNAGLGNSRRSEGDSQAMDCARWHDRPGNRRAYWKHYHMVTLASFVNTKSADAYMTNDVVIAWTQRCAWLRPPVIV